MKQLSEIKIATKKELEELYRQNTIHLRIFGLGTLFLYVLCLILLKFLLRWAIFFGISAIMCLIMTITFFFIGMRYKHMYNETWRKEE